MRKVERKEDAVSPVIGVMLMLVVTIIIAAVITGFATDLSKDTDKTPMVLFDVQYNNENGMIELKHKGGDAVRIQDIELILEQTGLASDNGIISALSKAKGTLTIRSEEDSSKETITTGDVILANIKAIDFPLETGRARWTLTYLPTTGVISNGEVVLV